MKNRLLRMTSASSGGVRAMQLISSLAVLYALSRPYPAAFWFLSLFVFFLTGCLGITVTFHRHLSHRSFRMPKFLEYIFSLLGALGGTGSALGWVALHRVHHQYSDRKEDPHSPANGKLQLLLSRYNFDLNKWAVRDLISDTFHRYVHAYYHLLLLLWSGLWLALGLHWWLFVVAVPMAAQIWVSILSNCLNHEWGYRNFETREKSTNNALVALLSWGEGWHNNHHMHPHRWNFQVRWWEFDPSSWVIRGIRLFTAQGAGKS